VGGTSGTVIVCTRDRQHLLSGCLASLDDQTAAPEEFDVLVVDNGSTDGTAGLLAEWAAVEPDRRRVIHEPVAGLSKARNTGIAAVAGAGAAGRPERDIVVFLDDDALAPKGWVDAHLNIYEQAPETAAAGGPVVLTWPEGRPHWLGPQLEHWFSALDHGERPGPFPTDHGPYGTNMSLRLGALRTVGGFTEQLGRKRRSLLSSEEAELWRRLWSGGFTVAYDPAALVLHRVAITRMTRRWLVRRGWGQGRSNARLRVLTGEVAGAGAVRQICVAESKFAVRLALRSARATLRGDAAGALDAASRCAGHTAAGLEQSWLLVRRARSRRDGAGADEAVAGSAEGPVRAVGGSTAEMPTAGTAKEI
jgi:glucosyl-dolichyl phosphate glucuronosyltransferase